MTAAMEGRKLDDNKARFDLMPPELVEVAQVLTLGAQTYGVRNWEKGMSWGRLFAAAMRHLWAFWRGEEADPDTGLSHLAHAACCVLFLLAYQRRQMPGDDRKLGP